jgi:hypothetical protein
MSKTPYEIRLEVLKMAQEIEMQHYYSKQERLMNNWQIQIETARLRNETPPEIPDMPEFPTHESILKKAGSLSEFINNAPKKD